MAGYINTFNPEALDHSNLTAAPEVVKDAVSEIARVMGSVAHGLSRVAFRRSSQFTFRMPSSTPEFPVSRDLYLTGITSAYCG